jgi:tellurium resistance protein TerD
MAIDLVKEQRIRIGLPKVRLDLCWAQRKGEGFNFEYDLDVSAFMLGENKKTPLESFFVFYNNLISPDAAVEHFSDYTDAGSGENRKTLMVDLSKLTPGIKEIIFTITIHDYEYRDQNFGQMENSFIRIYNARTNEGIVRCELDKRFAISTAVEFGRLYKLNDEWMFAVIGAGYKKGLQYFVDKYV